MISCQVIYFSRGFEKPKGEDKLRNPVGHEISFYLRISWILSPNIPSIQLALSNERELNFHVVIHHTPAVFTVDHIVRALRFPVFSNTA